MKLLYKRLRRVLQQLLILIRIIYKKYKKKNTILHKELLILLFTLYFIILFYIVTYRDNNYGTNNLILFKEIFRYKITSRLFIKNVIGNILLFMPFGIFIGYYIKKIKLYLVIILTLFLSCSIELIQLKIERTLDVDDILLNVIGGIIGYLFYTFQNKVRNIFQNEIIQDILCLITILIIIYLLFKLDFWRLLL